MSGLELLNLVSDFQNINLKHRFLYQNFWILTLNTDFCIKIVGIFYRVGKAQYSHLYTHLNPLLCVYQRCTSMFHLEVTAMVGKFLVCVYIWKKSDMQRKSVFCFSHAYSALRYATWCGSVNTHARKYALLHTLHTFNTHTQVHRNILVAQSSTQCNKVLCSLVWIKTTSWRKAHV